MNNKLVTFYFLVGFLCFNQNVLADISVDTSGLNGAISETIQDAKADREQRFEARRSSYNQRFVIVSADCIDGFGSCIADDLTVSGPLSVTINKNAGASVGIHPLSGNKSNLAGSYQFSVHLGNGPNKYCSGSFSLNGSEDNVNIQVHRSSCDIYVSSN